jgi:hypothetical protein
MPWSRLNAPRACAGSHDAAVFEGDDEGRALVLVRLRQNRMAVLGVLQFEPVFGRGLAGGERG